MTKTKIKYFGAGIAVLVIGGFVWHGHNKSDISQSATNVQGAFTEQQLTETTDRSSILLNPTQSSTKSTNGLRVGPSSAADNLGQINPNSSGSSNPSSNKSTQAANPIDPTTFVQYEKYKDGTSALFGELQVGTGDELTADKKAAVYYKGWLTNGQLFDATQADKDGKLQPFVFTMGAHQVIPGWEQAIFGMKVGGKRLLIVPPSVGYGPTGQGPIPGNAVLVFQVELLAVQ